MVVEKRKSGISLISLIITIIVIIILAAIVIFSGMDTPEKAQLSKIISDIDNVQTAVDQAYYGLYTEKAVAGEVWTQSQFYEAVATGETVRENLTGEGIVEISKAGLVDINLPVYEGRNWGVAVEDIDETTKVGSVVLLPGFDSEGKIYSTLLDIQNGGKDTALSTGIKTDIKVSNLKITTDKAGSTLAGTDVTEGTELYINFTASEGEETATISPAVPFKVTTNGSYEFTLTTSKGTKTYTVQVSNYKEKTLADTLKVGDYVEYEPDSSTYSTNTENTGYTSQTLETASDTKWRVLYIDPDTNEVLITTQGIVNSGTYLKGTKGYLRGASELNTICEKLYSKELYGKNGNSLTLKARSMTIEDLDKACGITEDDKISLGYGTRYAYYPKGTAITEGDTIEYNGNTYEKKAHGSSTAKFYTYDGGGVETTDSDGFTYSTPTADNPVYVTQTYYWYNPSSENATVSSILGYGSSNHGWLASPRVNLYSSDASFNVRLAYSSGVDGRNLYHSYGGSVGAYYGVRPLVSLGSKLQIDTSDTSRDGTSSKPYKIKIKE